MLLELILTLPIVLIALLAVVEFGLIQANLKQVALASREGARLAAETFPLNPATTSVIRGEVDRRLESAGFGPAATLGITIQETAFGGGPYTDGTCSVPVAPPMPLGAVRVTVCVPLDLLTPNLLQAFGYDITGLVAEHTTTYRHEL
ncbi:MAG: pilus assembly protein [Pirellulaceae bacterium]|nr:pilus assembly protein [Pirellulaceae bacterium]